VRGTKLHNTFELETHTTGGQMEYSFLHVPTKTLFFISILPSFLPSFLLSFLPSFWSIWFLFLQNYYIYFHSPYAFMFSVFLGISILFRWPWSTLRYLHIIMLQSATLSLSEVIRWENIWKVLIGFNQKFKYFSLFYKHCCFLPNTNSHMDCLQLII